MSFASWTFFFFLCVSSFPFYFSLCLCLSRFFLFHNPVDAETGRMVKKPPHVVHTERVRRRTCGGEHRHYSERGDRHTARLGDFTFIFVFLVFVSGGCCFAFIR